MKTVLVVQRDSKYADDFAQWLEGAGYRTRVCTGPGEPHYECWAEKFSDCPFWRQSELTIYDPWIQTGVNKFGSGQILRLEHLRHPGVPMLIWGTGAAIPKDIAAMEKPGQIEILPMDISREELVARVIRLIGPPDGVRTAPVGVATIAA